MTPGRAANAIIALTAICYPFIVYFGLSAGSTRTLALVLLAVGLARVLTSLLPGRRQVLPLLLGLVLMLLAAATWMRGNASLFRYYPVACNAVMLAVFAATLRFGPPMVERLARLREPELPPAAIAYTRKVTVAWCVFFIANGAAAAWTAVATDWATWSLYNGFIAYLLMGVLFAGEWLVRRRVRAAADGA